MGFALLEPFMASVMVGMETALLFCAIRAAETLGTVAFSRDTRAGFEIALCMKVKEDGLLPYCLTYPALILDTTLNPARYGSVASCLVPKASPKVRNKIQARLSTDQ